MVHYKLSDSYFKIIIVERNVFNYLRVKRAPFFKYCQGCALHRVSIDFNELFIAVSYNIIGGLSIDIPHDLQK